MKKLMLCVLLLGCDDRVPQGPIDNKGGGYEVQTLFVHDGCTVYRFEDRGHSRYWARCAETVTAISCDETTSTYMCGDSWCTRTDHSPNSITTEKTPR